MANITKNPFDAKKEVFEQALVASMSERLVASAQKIYQDLPFAQENRLKFHIAKVLSVAAGAVSFFTACFALSYILASTLGTYISWVVAGLISLLFELLKTEVWKQSVKGLLRYRKVSLVSLLILISLHLYSLGSSGFGAYLIPLTFTSTPAPPPPVDSALYQQAQQIDANIAALSAQNTQLQTVLINPDGKRSGTTSRAIASNNAAIKGLQIRKDEAMKRIESAINERKTAIAHNEQTHNDSITFQQQCTLIGALLMELLYVVCMCYEFYFLYRVFVDSLEIPTHDDATLNVAPIPTTFPTNDTTNVASNVATATANPAPDDRVVVKGFQHKNNSNSIDLITSDCQCCGTKFQHKHWGAKYCSTTCRNKAWRANKGSI